MRDFFVDSETAKLLKRLGFNEPCIAYYENGMFKIHGQNLDEFTTSTNKIIGWNTQTKCCSAPMWQQVKEWLFNKNEISVLTMAKGTDFISAGFNVNGMIYESDKLKSPIETEIYCIKGIINKI